MALSGRGASSCGVQVVMYIVQIGYVCWWHLVASVVVAMVGWDFEAKVLLGLPVLVMVTSSGAVHLLDGVAMELSFNSTSRGFSGENLRFIWIGRCHRSIGMSFFKASF